MISVLAFKGGLSILLCFVFLIVVQNKTLFLSFTKQNQTVWFLLMVFVLRILPFVVVYVIFNESPRSDVPMFYEAAVSAKQGMFVYRDFESAYSPLFSYLTAIPLVVWNSPKAIALLMLVVEIIVLWFTFLFQHETVSLYKTLLYLLLPAPFILVILGGQEDIWMWGFGLWSMWAWQKKQDELWLGIIFGLALLVTKALFILILPAIFFFVHRKVRFVTGLLVIGIPSLAFMYYHSELLFLSPIQQANDPRTPNIWTILHPLTNGLIPLGPKYLNWIGLLSILGITIFATFKLRKNTTYERFLPLIWTLTYSVMMIVQQSSLSNYAFIFLMPMLFSSIDVTDRTTRNILLLFNLAVVVQPPIWWGLNMPIFHHLSDLLVPIHLLEYVLEIAVMACLIYLIRNSWHRAKSAQQ